MLCDVSTGRPRPLVPTKLRRTVFNIVHGLAHPSIKSTVKLIKSKFVWYAMEKDMWLWAQACDTCQRNKTHQLGPRYEGQLILNGRAYSSFRSILLVLTHDFIIICVYGPTGSDGHERKDADAALRTIFVPFEAKRVLYAWGSVQPSNGPPIRTTSG